MTRATRQPDHWSGGPYALGVIIITIFVIVLSAVLLYAVLTNERKLNNIEDSVRQLDDNYREYKDSNNKQNIKEDLMNQINMLKMQQTDINDIQIKYHVLHDNYKEYKNSNNKQYIEYDGRFADLTKQINTLNMEQTALQRTEKLMWSNLEKNLKELRDSTKE